MIKAGSPGPVRWASLLIAAVSCLMTTAAGAQRAEAWVQAGSPVLGDARTLAVVDALGEQLRTPGGRATVGLLRESGLLDPRGDLLSAWKQVADALGLDPEQAAERVFGERVILAADGLVLPPPDDWAVAAQIQQQDVARLIKGLGASRRGVLAGRTVFGVERGRYRLSFVDRGEASAYMAVFGSASGDRFDTMVEGLSTDEGWAWATGRWLGGGPQRGGVLARTTIRGDEPVLLFAQAGPNGWSGVVTTRLPGAASVPTWDAESAERLSEGSALCLLGSISAEELAQVQLLPLVGVDLSAARAVLGQQARRLFFRIDMPASGVTDIVLACETADASADHSAAAGSDPRLSAAQVDEAMRALVGLLSSNPGSSPSFGGRLPQAVRVAVLKGRFAESLGGRVIGDAPALAWAVTEARPWLVSALAARPRAAGAVTRARAELDGIGPGPLVSAGLVRPGELGRVLERAAGLDRPVLGWVSGIESVRWQTRAIGEDRVKADFVLTMAATP